MNTEENEKRKADLAAKVAADNVAAIATITSDISYIKRDISDIKSCIHDMGAIYVTQTQHLEVTTLLHDHEQRIRYTEKNVTRIITIGSAIVIFAGIIEFIINKFL